MNEEAGKISKGTYPTWWDILGILLVFFAASYLSAKIVPLITGSEGGLYIFVSYAVQMLLVIGYALYMKKLRTGNFREVMRLSIRGMDPRVVLWGVIMTLSLGVVIEPLLEIFPDKYMDILGSVMSSGGWAMVTSIIAAPLLEETLFRGIIQEGLTKKYGAWPGIVIAAFIFGFVHLIPQQIVAAFIIGILLGYVYYRTRSLLSVIFIHAANNAFAQFALILTGDITMTTREAIGSDRAYWSIYVVCALIILISAISITIRTLKGRLDPVTAKTAGKKKKEGKPA